ncbi:MAG: hypothetical protein AAF797_17895 [Planctomycetota bacterium]
MKGVAMRGRSVRGFGLMELLVVLGVLVVLGSVALATTANNRRSARQATNSTQLRGIHQGCVIYAQGNRGHFPGLAGTGAVLPGKDIPFRVRDGRHTASRFALLLAANTFTPEYIINPADTDADLFEMPRGDQKDVQEDLLTTDHHSYATLNVDAPQGVVNERIKEWSETLNTRAVVQGDRNTGVDGGRQVSSVWTEQDSGDWRGTVVHNDNSTSFETTQVKDMTQYGAGEVNRGDSLFESEGGADALLTFYLNDRLEEERAERDGGPGAGLVLGERVWP